MSYLFTYGTLMKGQRACYRLENSRYVTDAVLHGYGLYETGSYPAAVPVEGFSVYGEVYEIDDETLRDCDEYEGEGNLYVRKLLKVEAQDRTYDVWVYEYNKSVKGMELRDSTGKWNMERKPYYDYTKRTRLKRGL